MAAAALRVFGVFFFFSLFLVGCNEPPKTQPLESKFPEKVETCGATSIPNQYVVKWKDGRITSEQAMDREAMIAAIVEPNLAEIERVEPDVRIHFEKPTLLAEEAVPVDPEWGQKIIRAPEVWAQGYRGQGITVAVIDSGVEITHSQIKNQLSYNTGEIADGKDNDGNGLIDDVVGYDFEANTGNITARTEHGTHVAGVILAQHSAGTVKGIADQAKLIPLNFMGNDGSGTLSGALVAIQYAVSRGARIINASWSSSGCSQILKDTLAYADSKGVMFVAAAGNSGANLERAPEYPAAYRFPGMLTVGASTSRDYMANFSNFSESLVHLLAPGFKIFSTVPNNQTEILSGTSMATPFVVGAAALLMSAKPSSTPSEVSAALLSGTDTGPFPVSTRGRLNIAKSLEILLKQ